MKFIFDPEYMPRTDIKSTVLFIMKMEDKLTTAGFGIGSLGTPVPRSNDAVAGKKLIFKRNSLKHQKKNQPNRTKRAYLFYSNTKAFQ